VTFSVTLELERSELIGSDSKFAICQKIIKKNTKKIIITCKEKKIFLICFALFTKLFPFLPFYYFRNVDTYSVPETKKIQFILCNSVPPQKSDQPIGSLYLYQSYYMVPRYKKTIGLSIICYYQGYNQYDIIKNNIISI
jgi:hypothetical protein